MEADLVGDKLVLGIPAFTDFALDVVSTLESIVEMFQANKRFVDMLDDVLAGHCVVVHQEVTEPAGVLEADEAELHGRLGRGAKLLSFPYIELRDDIHRIVVGSKAEQIRSFTLLCSETCPYYHLQSIKGVLVELAVSTTKFGDFTLSEVIPPTGNFGDK
jgi:hypothetical protein